jgi:hypothetical protein
LKAYYHSIFTGEEAVTSAGVPKRHRYCSLILNMKTCASGKDCQVPLMKESASFLHNCSRCRKPVHVWCLGENEEGGSKTCASCDGCIGPGAFKPPPLPPQNWESEGPVNATHSSTSSNNSNDLHATLKQKGGTNVKGKNHGIKKGNGLLNYFQPHVSKALDVKAADSSAINKRKCGVENLSDNKKMKVSSTSDQLFASTNAVIDVIKEAKDVVQNEQAVSKVKEEAQ